jgi:ATP-dependent exoDNAse (exonuclease V) alpha subunit
VLQEEALSILKTGRNVFLTGEPGSGKTYTINRYVEWLNSNRIQVAVTASTGIAASHINGQTIHSWSGIGIKSIITSDDLSKIRNNKHVAKRIAETKVLIIDEVSLLQSKTLSVIERVCRTIRRSAEVFGGIQIVLVGDFFQIPPVEEFNASSNDAGSDFFSMRPQDDRKFAFESSVWSELGLAICYLSEQHRQEDEQFLELLSAIRKNSVSEAHRILLKARIFREPPDGVPKLFSSNAQVDHLNQQVIDKIKEEEITYPMEERGPKALVDRLKKFCLSHELLTLKKGAQVMFTKNDFVKRQYVNGTLGIVHEIKNGALIVRTKKGGFIEVGPSEWKILQQLPPLEISLNQLPQIK